VGLTSMFFLGLTAVVAIGSVAATVWLWPRLASQRIAVLAARLGLIVTSQVLVLAAVAAFLNGYFAFFASWSSLFGAESAPSVAAGAAASSRPIVVTGSDLGPVPGGSDLPELADGRLASKPPHVYAQSPPPSNLQVAPGLDLKGGAAAAARAVGKVLQVTVSGEHTGIVSAADYVYLPPQYFQPAYAHTRFPVVLALTGYPNDPWSIVKRLALPATAARLAAGGQIKPAVYVMMNVSVALPRDTECTNVPEGPQAETFFTQDVPLAVERTFRVQTARSGWAVLGYSTGGYCAAKLAMMDPYQFSSAVSMAGYYTATEDSTTGDLYGGSGAYRNENNLDWRLTHLPPPPVSVLVTSSQQGELDLPGTLAFLKLIRPPMRGYSLIVPSGGHNYGTWQRQLPQSLAWLNQRLSPARPQAQSAPSRAQPTPSHRP
jgi:S-formylglutathione hydrolase FrmB